jgi:hypothetical protein
MPNGMQMEVALICFIKKQTYQEVIQHEIFNTSFSACISLKADGGCSGAVGRC